MSDALSYPESVKGDDTDVYHGVHVPDPYRWLEDSDSPATSAWVARQNQLTHDWLEGVEQRPWIRERARQLMDHERIEVPSESGGCLFYFRNAGLERQATLYVVNGDNAEPRVLLDPNQLSADGTVAVVSTSVSADGTRLAYALSSGGSDWVEWRVRDVASANDFPDRIPWSKFSEAAWAPDASGFYYCAYDPPADTKTRLTAANFHQRVHFHRLGDDSASDVVVYRRDDQPRWGFRPHVTDDGSLLILSVWQGTARRNQIFYLDRNRPGSPIVELIVGFDALYDVIGSRGRSLFVKTDRAASRARIVRIDLDHPEPESWGEIVPESAATLESARIIGGKIVASYLDKARSRLHVFNLDGGSVAEVALPGIGTVLGPSGRDDSRRAFFGFTSFTAPTTIFSLDPGTGAASLFRSPRTDFTTTDFETTQVFFTSKDGTRIPMFLSHRRGLELDSARPTLLYGYGGFRISLTPAFSAAALLWMEMGGVYAVANLRGGGEFGDDWHQAGTLLAKQNVFDDFIAAADWLTTNRYTSAARLAIAGGSNGGLLVGACLLQAPDRFAAAIAQNGVHDMLRYHRFTIGWAWASDYGTVDDDAQFHALYAYSPVHNAVPGRTYPATLITTADHDDRVVPAHSYKFAAALQAAQTGPVPVLLRVDIRVGHGMGKPTDKMIEEIADRWAFLARTVGGLQIGD